MRGGRGRVVGGSAATEPGWSDGADYIAQVCDELRTLGLDETLARLFFVFESASRCYAPPTPKHAKRGSANRDPEPEPAGATTHEQVACSLQHVEKWTKRSSDDELPEGAAMGGVGRGRGEVKWLVCRVETDTQAAHDRDATRTWGAGSHHTQQRATTTPTTRAASDSSAGSRRQAGKAGAGSGARRRRAKPPRRPPPPPPAAALLLLCVAPLVAAAGPAAPPHGRSSAGDGAR